jgi:serine O-acetyltransferase
MLLHRTACSLLPRSFTEYAHSKTGIDIHPSATIDVPFMIIMVPELLLVKPQLLGSVSIYQGVTLGALQVERACKRKNAILQLRIMLFMPMQRF